MAVVLTQAHYCPRNKWFVTDVCTLKLQSFFAHCFPQWFSPAVSWVTGRQPEVIHTLAHGLLRRTRGKVPRNSRD